MVFKLNYDLIPQLDYTAAFMCLPMEMEEAIKKFPATAERIEGALLFCGKLWNCEPKQSSSAAVQAGSYFRAAIAEYVSIEEILNQELPRDKPRFKLLDTENPLPHILKLLRNLQVHLVTNRLSDSTINLILKRVPGAEPVDVSIWTIDDLTDAQLIRLDAFKRTQYNKTQATEMAQWLNDAQARFGIHDIIHRAVVEVAERIIATYIP